MKKHILLLLTLFVIFFYIGCKENNSFTPVKPPTAAGPVAEPVEFTVAASAELRGLDPHFAETKLECLVASAFFEGLFVYDPATARAVPGLAEKWKKNERGDVYTFTLRRTAWSDGVPITAQTVADSWLRLLSPESVSPQAWFPSMFIIGAMDYSAGISSPETVGIKPLDEYTLKIELIKPIPYFLDILSHHSFTVVPIHLIESLCDDWTEMEHITVNGPFSPTTWIPENRLTAVKNKSYWNSESVRLDSIRIIQSEDAIGALKSYESGEADWTMDIPGEQVYTENVDYQVSPILTTYYYIIQNERPPFHNVKLRKALSMAIDRTALIEEIVKNAGIPAYGLVPSMSGYRCIDGNGFDHEMAREYLAQAGFADGTGFPKFTILYNATDNNKRIVEFIRNQWASHLNIRCDLAEKDWTTYSGLRRAGNFQIIQAGWIEDIQDPIVFLQNFISGAALNSGRYSNKEFDSKIEEAAGMDMGTERTAALNRAEEILITEDQSILPIYYYSSTNMIDKMKWGGWYTNPLDVHPLKNIYLMPITKSD